MAVIYIRDTEEVISGEEHVRQFLASQEVLYEYWNPAKLPEELQNVCHLNEEEKKQVLATFNEEIQSLAERRGYKKWDVISLNQDTPELENLLKKFEQVHTHTEDEVRAITAGSGTFVIKGEKTGYFDVRLSPGDVISVPVNVPHFFTLSEEKQVVAVRLFIDPEGWVAHTFDDPEFEKTKAN